MNPTYNFTLNVVLKQEGLRRACDREYAGEITVTDAQSGDDQDKEELPKVAAHLLTRIAQEHPEIMRAEGMRFSVSRRKSNKKGHK